MEVQITSRKLITPSSPTPPHLQNTRVTCFDQLAPFFYVPTIFYYPVEGEEYAVKNAEKSLLLQKSLSEILTLYHPFAGRYARDNLSIECNDKGVEYLEAKVYGSLSQFLQRTSPNHLVQQNFHPHYSSPLAVQFNEFECGGVAIGISMTHKIGDGFTMFTLINKWATACRIGVNKVHPPSFELGIIFPPREASRVQNVVLGRAPTNKIVTKKFVFDGEAISNLKVAASASSSQFNRHQLTRVKVVTALIWSAFIRVDQAREEEKESEQNDQNTLESQPNSQPTPLSKNAQKKLLKQQKWEAKKAEKKAQVKEQKMKEAERKRKEWEERLSSCASEEERLKLIESRRELRKERMEKRAEEKEDKVQRLSKAKEFGQNIVIDLEFADLMTNSEIHSLVQQIMYCYAVNRRCTSPGHLWLTGCRGEMENQLQRLPGFDKWIIEKESQSYIDALQDQKENLVYLTADSETVLDELDLKKIYIIGGLVDRNRWKGITMKKASEQGIQTAKLPIGSYLKMSSSQVLTVNQVVEILLKFVEIKDWKASFFQVIPQRKRGETDSEELQGVDGEELENEDDPSDKKKRCIEVRSTQ